jgi:hypothetical protein
MKKKPDVRKAKDPIQVWVKEVKQAKKDPIQMWVKVVEQPKKGPIQMWVKEVKDDRGDGERASMRATVSIVDEDGARHYQETKTVLREQRSVLIDYVLDRIVSAIKSYPLPAFDPILTLVEEIRRRAQRDLDANQEGEEDDVDGC